MRRRIGDGPGRLRTLLDALEADLLAAPADELSAVLRETGRARDSACQEVRSLLDEALASSEEAASGTPPARMATRNGLLRH